MCFKTQPSNINNLCYKKDGLIVHTEKSNELTDYNSLPVLAYHLIQKNSEELLSFVQPFYENLYLTIRTSVGCPYSCKYCGGVPGWNNVRYRDAKNIEKDILYLQETLGEYAQLRFIDDELFTYNKKHVKEISTIFKKHLINLVGVLGHVNYFDQGIAKDLKKFSNSIMFGVENLSDDVLKSLDKGQDLSKIENSIKIAKNEGLNVRLEFIVGLPKENITSIVFNLNKAYNMIASSKEDRISHYICPSQAKL